MSKIIDYLKKSKNYFEKKYVYNLTVKNVYFICFLIGNIIGYSYRISCDGLTYNLIFPIFFVVTNTRIEDYILLSLISAPTSYLFVTYVNNVKDRINLEKR